MLNYDVVIIGAGPGGVSASLYIKRASINCLVIGSNKSSLMNARIDNFYSYLDESGEELFLRGIEQLKKNNIDYLNDEVIDINFDDNGYLLTTIKNEKVITKSIVFATGNKKNIDNKFSDFLGRGLSLCGHCDAPLHRNSTLYFTGKKDYLFNLENELKLYSEDVVYIDEDDIEKLEGKDYLESIVLKDKIINTNILFYGCEISPLSLLFKLGLEIDEKGLIKVDSSFKTNLPLVYACGDCIDIIHQVNSACYSGMMAGLNLVKELKKNG